MKILSILVSLLLSSLVKDMTLRVDYIFGGNDHEAAVSLARMSCTDGWYGRSVNMDSLPVKGNGSITVTDEASGKVLYCSSFSTLFQEWQATPEAKELTRSFQNTYLLPMPSAKAVVKLVLYDVKGREMCSFSHKVDPDDILIGRRAQQSTERRYIHKGGEPRDVIDVVILAEGYTSAQRDLFYADASAAVEAVFAHEPFASMKECFNFLAVAPASADSGVSVPRRGEWKQTPVLSHFDTFYSQRYLTTSEIFRMHDLLDGLPYEHLIVLANTDTYGGGGIYNSYTLTTAHHAQFRPVVVHEFGHSFAALADEYAYAGDEDPYYFADVEPWEKNITTKADFASKWQDMLEAGIDGVGLFEGAGYQAKGVYRPAEDCRMRTNQAGEFCPVCQRAIRDMIMFYTKEK